MLTPPSQRDVTSSSNFGSEFARDSPQEGSGFEISVPRYPRGLAYFRDLRSAQSAAFAPKSSPQCTCRWRELDSSESRFALQREFVIVIERTSSDRGSRRSVGLSYGLAMIAISAILQVLCFNWCSWFSRRSRRPLWTT